MIVNLKDILSLDDNNEYVAVIKINVDDMNYFYLIDKNDNSNLKFSYLENDELVELNDKELVTRLLPLFVENAKGELEGL